MTSLYPQSIRCGVCGCESTVTMLLSTNQFGRADLDLRPPEMARSTMHTWVQQCPGCGYSSVRLDDGDPGLRDFLGSEEYRAALHDPEVTPLAAAFACKALLDERRGEIKAAAWDLIYAAWACDDADAAAEARAYRIRGAHLLGRAEELGQTATMQPGVCTVVLVDLFRRSGQSALAMEIYNARRALITDEYVVQVLDFERALIEPGDTACHNLDEVFA